VRHQEPARPSSTGNGGATTADRTIETSDGLDRQTCRWVEETTEGRVVGVERFTKGREAWWVDVETAAGVRRWLLKGRRVPVTVIARSRLLRDFGAGREAAAMAALRGTAIPVAELGGYEPGSASLLLGRVPGSALLQRVAPAERRALMADYAHHLAALHALDWRELPLAPTIPVPSSPEEMAVGGWLASAEADAATSRAGLRHAEPVLDMVTWWLHHARPQGRGLEHLRFLHGDAGVNNFMFDNGRVTALIDWELAVLGDPMSDLGNARLREALYPTGTFAGFVGDYEVASGRAVDRAAIGYYTVLAASMLSLAMVANVHRPRASQPEAVVRLWQDAVARVVACEALCEAIGLSLAPVEAPGGGWSAFDPLPALLVDHLDRLGAGAEGSQSRADALGYAQLARSVRLLVSDGRSTVDALLADCAPVLGWRPDDVPSALAALSERVQRDPEAALRTVLPVVAVDARRRLELLRPLQAAEVWDDAEPVTQPDLTAPSTPLLPPF
jgi:aminoglycoside phosphotransferase (APT) family kinase protein